MTILLKLSILLFLLFWCGLGGWMIIRYHQLFGLHPDDPAESPGARSFNLTQVWSVWFGVFAMTVYFLFS